MLLTGGLPPSVGDPNATETAYRNLYKYAQISRHHCLDKCIHLLTMVFLKYYLAFSSLKCPLCIACTHPNAGIVECLHAWMYVSLDGLGFLLVNGIVLYLLTCLVRRVLGQNAKYYQRFPDDVEAVQNIVTHLIRQPEGGVRTPSGNLLTPRSLQVLGLSGARTIIQQQ